MEAEKRQAAEARQVAADARTERIKADKKTAIVARRRTPPPPERRAREQLERFSNDCDLATDR